MNERSYRIAQGIVLLAALYFDLKMVIYAYIGLQIFEGITNWRIPVLWSRFTGQDPIENPACSLPRGVHSRFDFEAERALRLAVAGILVISYVIFPAWLWFIPWLTGFSMVSAGMIGLCPFVMGFRQIGFK